MSQTITLQEMLKEQLEDPDFREGWERTAFARAVANQVIKYRIEHGLSQSALARRLDVSQAVVGRLELGEHEPKLATLRRLAERLGLSFAVDIHPEGRPATHPAAGATVERIRARGVELVVASA